MAPKRLSVLGALSTIALLLALPAASAHERYTSDDGSLIMVIGEQNEPVYTYDFTNLDFIVSEEATGDPITGVEESVDATLIAPNNDELTLPLEAQHGTEGRYQFVQDYVLTMPGQYKVRLTGTINGVDVSGEYLLPGPRGSFTDITFPDEDIEDLRALQDENARLAAELDALRGDVEALQAQVDEDDGTAEAPAPGFLAIGVVLAALAAARWRRDA